MPYVPPKYPGEIPTAEDLPDRTDDIDWLYAARYNELKKELRAALIELGVDPAGAFDTVVARLDAMGVPDKIAEGDSSVEVIDTDADGHVEVKTEGVLCGKFNSDGILDLLKQSRCRAYKSAAAQTIATATWAKIVLDVETYDNQNEFDPVTNYRFTAKKAGVYHISAQLLWYPVTANKRYTITIRVNGADRTRSPKHSGVTQAFSCSVSDILALAANDYVELWGYHVAGVDRNVVTSSIYTFMAIHKLS